MLTELSVVEQRYLAVREVLDGARVSSAEPTAVPFGVHPATRVDIIKMAATTADDPTSTRSDP